MRFLLGLVICVALATAIPDPQSGLFRGRKIGGGRPTIGGRNNNRNEEKPAANARPAANRVAPAPSAPATAAPSRAAPVKAVDAKCSETLPALMRSCQTSPWLPVKCTGINEANCTSDIPKKNVGYPLCSGDNPSGFKRQNELVSNG
ncbi:uncharacterized protein [Palaemon carinicauda]|uniref:uncharacterized protein n=1 Tax=Palaemon carinicauda TaxID=392227 RepID=UPI0035B66FF1